LYLIPSGTFLERSDYAPALEEFVILALGIMLAVVLPRVSAKASAAIGLLTIALVFFGGWAVYQYANIFLDPSYPALVLGFLTAAITLYTISAAPSANTLLPRWSSSWRTPRKSWC
jgi:hypothetical protein